MKQKWYEIMAAFFVTFAAIILILKILGVF